MSINPYDEGTPEWEIFETEGEPDEEPFQIPRVWGLRQPTPEQIEWVKNNPT